MLDWCKGFGFVVNIVFEALDRPCIGVVYFTLKLLLLVENCE